MFLKSMHTTVISYFKKINCLQVFCTKGMHFYKSVGLDKKCDYILGKVQNLLKECIFIKGDGST